MIEHMNIVLTGASSGIGYEVLSLLDQGEGNKILAVALDTDNLVGISDKIIPFTCDVSSEAGVDAIFEKANEVFEGKKIDLFYANAGFPYYEVFDYTDWERIKKMFDTNSLSPIYTYAKYIRHLKGRKGILAYTVSAIGQMAMPGYAIYSSSKFALHGFQQAIRLEMPKNLQVTCLYPIATNTNFFNVANLVPFEKPFPVQEPSEVAVKMVKGIENGSKFVYPSGLFSLAKVLMAIIPPIRSIYWGLETKKLERFKKRMRAHNRQLQAELVKVSHGIQETGKKVVPQELREKSAEVTKILQAHLEKDIEMVKGKLENVQNAVSQNVSENEPAETVQEPAETVQETMENVQELTVEKTGESNEV